MKLLCNMTQWHKDVYYLMHSYDKHYFWPMKFTVGGALQHYAYQYTSCHVSYRSLSYFCWLCAEIWPLDRLFMFILQSCEVALQVRTSESSAGLPYIWHRKGAIASGCHRQLFLTSLLKRDPALSWCLLIRCRPHLALQHVTLDWRSCVTDGIGFRSEVLVSRPRVSQS